MRIITKQAMGEPQMPGNAVTGEVQIGSKASCPVNAPNRELLVVNPIDEEMFDDELQGR